MSHLTEDQVRVKAKNITGCDFGQVTTFKTIFSDISPLEIKQLNSKLEEKYRIKNINNLRPDGWYLPQDKNKPAIMFELKSSDKKLNYDDLVNQLKKYMFVVTTKYKRVIGILYNGEDTRIFKYIDKTDKIIEINNISKELKHKEYYIKFVYELEKVDKQMIQECTKRINDLLHFKFGLSDLNNRMVFTSCALVAKFYGAEFISTESIKDIKSKIVNTLNDKILNIWYSKNDKLKNLTERIESIFFDKEPVQKDIYEFLYNLDEISYNINSINWNGEDVMAIFFNEFSRYKGKSDNGQVFTPDHICSLMYQLANISYKNNVLDACCGSGTFLIKAMSNMINEVQGDKDAIDDIKENRLYGIENDKTIYSLACANMLIHKDGKSNIIFLDSTKEEACEWIKSKKITKVLMNPPYEKRYNPIKILSNVLNSVEHEADCLFLMPNNKLRTNKSQVEKILKKHRLTHIIKLPKDTFTGKSSPGDVSIFIFKAHKPQNDNKIIGFNILDDGLNTIKLKGRHDTNNIWKEEIEPYWIEAIKTSEDHKYKTKKIIDPNKYLEYPDDYNEQNVYEEDFENVILERILYEKPDIAIKLEKKSKNNPSGLTLNDLLISLMKTIEEF